MALISCSECQSSVSDKASTCPQCGCPIRDQHPEAYAGKLPKESTIRDRRKKSRFVGTWIIGLATFIPIILGVFIYARNKAVGPIGWAQDNTEKALKERMKDPSSMVIKASYVVKKTNENGDESIYVCGVFDGKNSFGAYGGGTRFASWSSHSKSLGTFDTISIQIESPEQQRNAEKVGLLSGFDKVYWNEWCVDEIHPAVVVKKED